MTPGGYKIIDQGGMYFVSFWRGSMGGRFHQERL